jgi:hypothetical protein
MEKIIKLGQEGASAEKETAGTKAELLSKAMNHVKVCDGIIIPKGYFEAFLDKCMIRKQVENLLMISNTEDKERLQSIANDIQRLIVTASMPKEIEDEILEMYHTIGISKDKPLVELVDEEHNPEVIIRPSAVPLPEEGRLHLAFFRISEQAKLIKNIKMCWASLYTYSAIKYRLDNDIKDFSMALVMQEFIEIDVTCALIPYDIDSGAKDRYTVFAVFGYGEGLDDSSIAKDIYKITKETLEPGIEEISHQSGKYAFDSDSRRPKLVDVGKETGGKQKLDELYIIEAAKAMNKLNTKLCKELSGEFALDHNKQLYLVELKEMKMQKRPSPEDMEENAAEAAGIKPEEKEEKKEEDESFIEFEKLKDNIENSEIETVDIDDEPDYEDYEKVKPQEKKEDVIAKDDVPSAEEETLSREFEKKEEPKKEEGKKTGGLSLFNLFKGKKDSEEQQSVKEDSQKPQEPKRFQPMPAEEQKKEERVHSTAPGAAAASADELSGQEQKDDRSEEMAAPAQEQEDQREDMQTNERTDSAPETMEKEVMRKKIFVKEETVVPSSAVDASAHDMLTSAKHTMNHAVVLSDMAITNHLKKRYNEIFNARADMTFEEMLQKISEKTSLPLESEIRKVRALRNRFLENYKSLKLDQIDFAIQTAEKFLEEF